MVLTFGMVGVLIAFPSREEQLGIALAVITVLGMIPLLTILNVPFMKRREPPIPDSSLGRPLPPRKDWSGEFKDSVRMDILPIMVVPILVITMVSLVLAPDLVTFIITVPVMAILVLAVVFFWNLDIRADRKVLSFHFGPVGRDLHMEEIVSIRPTMIHPIRDFMGWGWRSGSDGSIGYISWSRTGVRIETLKGRNYVISCHRPQELSDHVRWSRAKVRGR